MAHKSSPGPQVKPLFRSASAVPYRNPFFKVEHTRATFPGFEKDYFVVNFGRRGGVVAVRNGAVLLVRQYRFLLGEMSWEVPGGTVLESEDIQAGLRRECLEETGVALGALRPLIEYYPGLDNVDNRTSIFACEELRIASAFAPNPAEVVALDWFPLARCLQMVFSGQILDAMTIAGLLAYAQRTKPRKTRSGTRS
jgi:8-oxo-dGTP pyrophosphatase MutT (NUDIX family)